MPFWANSTAFSTVLTNITTALFILGAARTFDARPPPLRPGSTPPPRPVTTPPPPPGHHSSTPPGNHSSTPARSPLLHPLPVTTPPPRPVTTPPPPPRSPLLHPRPGHHSSTPSPVTTPPPPPRSPLLVSVHCKFHMKNLLEVSEFQSFGVCELRSGKAANPGTGQWKSNSTITSCPAGGGGAEVAVYGSGIFSKCMLGDLATCYSAVENQTPGMKDLA
ncbi:hypothetical protein KOW79_014330 [Hemibagrus wyckioides]|uniref:Uncharacterized protein n=1 Tax=Hemibagrus wyckioides TaxID=337641 RepID=A0A9D3SKY9_9TELE|nr:hypothetical protein KOW79_014330 [Hemibagrus wyckioides]